MHIFHSFSRKTTTKFEGTHFAEGRVRLVIWMESFCHLYQDTGKVWMCTHVHVILHGERQESNPAEIELLNRTFWQCFLTKVTGTTSSAEKLMSPFPLDNESLSLLHRTNLILINCNTSENLQQRQAEKKTHVQLESFNVFLRERHTKCSF